MFDVKDMIGVIPAILTPFNEDESFSQEKMEGLVDYLLENKVAGLYLTGSTGEGFLMSSEERMKVVEVVIRRVQKRVPVIVHVGALSTMKSIELAQQAQRVGADAISSVPPFYWRFSPEAIFRYYEELSNSVDLPMIVYKVALINAGMDLSMVERLASIPNVKGIKYTDTNHYEMQRIRERLGEDFMIYSGADEMALSGLTMGANGIIGSFYGLMPEIFVEIERLYREDRYKEAKELQILANDVIQVFLKFDYYSAMKLALGWMGIDVGICRRPFLPLTANEQETLRKDLIALKSKKDYSRFKLMRFIG